MTEPGRPVLELSGVDVPFGDAPGLRGIDLVVGSAERFVLVGGSGAGKSCLLRAIAGVGPFTAGAIRVEGRPVTGLSPRELGLVLLEQRPLLFPHLSVRGNVAFPLEVRGVSAHEVTRRVADVLDAVRIPGLAERMPHTLSGGQAHRVALARAVVVRPRILLLDEPMTSLDPSLREEMREVVVEVAGRYRTALLVVTHDLREAGRVGERVGVLLQGRLAHVGPPETLFRDPATLEVARFIGWRNEVPALLEEDGSLRIGTRTLPGPWIGSAGAPAAPGPVIVSFGPHGARLRADGSADPLPVRITAVRHEPGGATVAYRFDPPSNTDTRSTSPARPDNGEVAMPDDAPPAVGEVASLEILSARARVFPAPDPSEPEPP